MGSGYTFLHKGLDPDQLRSDVGVGASDTGCPAWKRCPNLGLSMPALDYSTPTPPFLRAPAGGSLWCWGWTICTGLPAVIALAGIRCQAPWQRSFDGHRYLPRGGVVSLATTFTVLGELTRLAKGEFQRVLPRGLG